MVVPRCGLQPQCRGRRSAEYILDWHPDRECRNRCADNEANWSQVLRATSACSHDPRRTADAYRCRFRRYLALYPENNRAASAPINPAEPVITAMLIANIPYAQGWVRVDRGDRLATATRSQEPYSAYAWASTRRPCVTAVTIANVERDVGTHASR